MLAVAISLLFGLAAFASIAVIHASIVHGKRRADEILHELAAGERRPVRRISRESWRPAPARQPRFAAA